MADLKKDASKPDDYFSEVIPLDAYRDMPPHTSADLQEGTPQPKPKRDSNHETEVDMECATMIEPEVIEWLWDGWLANGKLHMLAGAPGSGKTTIALSLAATISSGGDWRDGSKAPTGYTVIWSGEDDPADTLIPRLILAGADLKRIYIIKGCRERGEYRAFDPAYDMEPLRRALEKFDKVSLLIVDPIVSAITGDGKSNSLVRRALQPFVDLGSAVGCAVLGITHLTKGTSGREPVERINGSIAFGALARVVMMAARFQEQDEGGGERRLLCRAKSNIGPDGGGFEYGLTQTELTQHPGISASAVQWGKQVEGTARELLAEADAYGDDKDGSTLSERKQFLTDLLADGPMLASLVFKRAKDFGYSEDCMWRTARALKVLHGKDGFQGPAIWKLRPAEQSPSKGGSEGSHGSHGSVPE